MNDTTTPPVSPRDKAAELAEKQRQKWLKERSRRNGAPRKIRFGLRRKLFLIILSLIMGLLGIVYTLTLTDEERVLRRELTIRGATVARNLADSIYNTYANLVQEKAAKPNDPFVFDPDSPSGVEPVQFSDAMKKASQQQDFIECYALDPQNRAFVHSARKGYLFQQQTPPEVFDFKAVYPVMLHLRRQVEKQQIPVAELNTPGTTGKLLKQFIGLRSNLPLFDKTDEKLQLALTVENGSIILLKTDRNNRTARQPLNLAASNLPAAGKLALKLIVTGFENDRLFLKTTGLELRRIRRSAVNPADKQLLLPVITELEEFLQKKTLFATAVLKLLPRIQKQISPLRDEGVKAETVSTVRQLQHYFLRFNPIVQQLQQRLTGNRTREVLYITYPMCETDKYFRTYRGEIHLIMSQRGITYTIRFAKEKLQLAAVGAVASGALLTLILALFITSPVKKLMRAMRHVGAGDLNQTVLVGVSDEIGVLADNFNEMTEGLREKEKIRSAMNKAVSKDVAEVMLSGELKLGGDNKVITVLFSDIRSFTTISEAHTPEQVVEMLNEYMTLMTNIVEKHRGVVDKFVGDEIMALWGAPKSYGNDAIAAVKAALEMMKVLGEFNGRRQAAGLLPIDIGIGLNTGEVIAGNMGSQNRMNYTVIGDNVNLGARLEGTNKMYGTHIIISEYTYNEVKELVYARELDLIRVKGKSQPVSIYEVLDLTPAGEQTATTAE